MCSLATQHRPCQWRALTQTDRILLRHSLQRCLYTWREQAHMDLIAGCPDTRPKLLLQKSNSSQQRPCRRRRRRAMRQALVASWPPKHQHQHQHQQHPRRRSAAHQGQRRRQRRRNERAATHQHQRQHSCQRQQSDLLVRSLGARAFVTLRQLREKVRIRPLVAHGREVCNLGLAPSVQREHLALRHVRAQGAVQAVAAVAQEDAQVRRREPSVPILTVCAAGVGAKFSQALQLVLESGLQLRVSLLGAGHRRRHGARARAGARELWQVGGA
mmetsp:Transcript_101425/g.257942  ORF Transcript_101425/g.257942 Transcript_101425/m.257942 type:complete len:272 (-) Transcript_101425:21-836(-)